MVRKGADKKTELNKKAKRIKLKHSFYILLASAAVLPPPHRSVYITRLF